MESKIVRVAQGKESTLSQLYINGIFQCYLLEDKIREVKIPSQTAIPTGVFTLKLNTYGAKNVDYKRVFTELHEGMIEPTRDSLDALSSTIPIIVQTSNYHGVYVNSAAARRPCR